MRIMYIDDDEDDRDLVKRALNKKRPDIDLFLAASGSDGYQRLKMMAQAGEGLPCQIILDLNMPGWNGKETFQKLREEKELVEIPVAVFTSSSSPYDKKFFSSEKSVQYFTKPTEPSRLDQILDEILKHC